MYTQKAGGFCPVPDRISERSEHQPKSVALEDGGRQLTFAELDRKAEQFARYLAHLGVASGDTVAVCLERSFDWIVSALGIMRAGAAYVPLDSSWPDSRLRFALSDSRATAMVARTSLLDRLDISIHGIDPCRHSAAIAAASPAPRRSISPDNLAYLIYTSGSTGVPKGVEITHANLCHFVEWHQHAFAITPRDRASHVAGLGFDVSVWELWPNLSAGATVCLVDDTVRRSPALLQQWLIDERITVAFVPTLHATSLIEMEWPYATELRCLLTGGDVLPRHPVDPLPFSVVNNYGPAEATIVATSTVLEPAAAGVPPIGCAIPGATIYLLGEDGEPVPDGVIGEIFIGGNGVGAGYRNLPELTSQRFLPDRFASMPDARMYRTGDLASRRPNGQLEFHGRLDRQTKIRGHRIELDEIGTVLARHGSIEFAVVVTSTSAAGEKELVAHVLIKQNAPIPTVQELQEHLLTSLPHYMVPATYVRLDTLPISPNGKIDYNLLREPTEITLVPRKATTVAPSPIAARLLAMMRELLRDNTVLPEDNFFLAGGHSLLAMQLVMRVRDAFGIDLTLPQLFAAPTVEHLSLTVEQMLVAAIDAMSEEEAEQELAR